jgi:GTP-binding protein
VISEKGYSVHRISAVTGQGVQELVYDISEHLEKLGPRERTAEDEVVTFTVEPELERWEVKKTGANEYLVEGKPVEIIIARTNVANEYAFRRLHRQLDRMGVIKALRKAGAQDGDTVNIYDVNGRRVRELRGNSTWDGRDDDNMIVESGLYIYQIKRAGKIISGTIVVAK